MIITKAVIETTTTMIFTIIMIEEMIVTIRLIQISVLKDHDYILKYNKTNKKNIL